MNIPNWWQFALLSIAAWRIFQLIAFDDIFDAPRRLILRLGREWKTQGDPVPDNYRLKTALFLTCPYCFGFWVFIACWGAWLIWPHAVTVAAVPFAGSAIVIALSKILSDA